MRRINIEPYFRRLTAPFLFALLLVVILVGNGRGSVAAADEEFHVLHHHTPYKWHPVTIKITETSVVFVSDYAPEGLKCSLPPEIPIESVSSVKQTNTVFVLKSGGKEVEAILEVKVKNRPNSGSTQDYRFTPQSAREVKASKEKLGGVFNIVGTTMLASDSAVREFQDVERSLKSAMDRRAAALAEQRKMNALPPALVTSVQFDDTMSFLPDNQLEAGKEAQLVVTISNKGQGPGYSVKLVVSSDMPQVAVLSPYEVGDILPGQDKTVRLSTKAGLKIPQGEVTLLVETKEKRGYDARGLKLIVPTVSFAAPALTISTPTRRAESGETVELIASVRNSGSGPAVASVLSVAIDDPAIQIGQGQIQLGVIRPNQTVEGRVVFTIPRSYSKQRLQALLTVRDGRGDAVAAAQLPMEIPVVLRSPAIVISYRLLNRGREVKEITNGQSFEVEVSAQNNGSLDAERVVLGLAVEGNGVTLKRNSAEIGVLPMNSTATAQRFELDVPRSFVLNRLPLSMQLTQSEFGREERTLDIPVKVRQPALTESFSIQSRPGGQAIEQNETADLELRVQNNGDLAAQGVRAQLDLTATGVEIQGPRILDLGAIPPTEQRLAKFRLRVLRSAKPGEMPIRLTINQSDFAAAPTTLTVEVRAEEKDEKRVTAEPSAVRAQPNLPVVTVAAPRNGQSVSTDSVELRGTIADQRGISRLNVEVNGEPVADALVKEGLHRRPAVSGQRDQADFGLALKLKPGSNKITVRVYNVDNETDHFDLDVTRVESISNSQAPVTLTAVSDVDRDVMAFTAAPENRRRWAVVIGVETYLKKSLVPDVQFAGRDALFFREYAIKVLGIPADQVFLLLNSDATKSGIQVVLEDRLRQSVQPGDEVYVYFAGHGLPDPNEKKPYLLPVDGDPQSLRISGYSLSDFYKTLGQLKAANVTVFIDACFSGMAGRQERPQPLFAGTRYVGIEVDETAMPPNVYSLSAARGDQLSNAYPLKAHGLFTYFLLQGLGSASSSADSNEDGNLILSELAEFTTRRVTQVSLGVFGANQQQTPVFRSGGQDKPGLILKRK